MDVMSEHPIRKHQTVYFADQELADRFNAWCKHRNLAPGKVLMILIEAFMDELDLQKDMMEISLSGKDVRFV